MEETVFGLSKNEIRDDLKKRLDEKRFYHTLGVEHTAACLAMYHGVDVERADLAGLLHDCGKYGSAEKQIGKCEKYGIKLETIEIQTPSLVHAKLGAYYAQKRYGVTDDEILSAILYHTTGKPEMTLLEKIIYLADYIEPTRDFDGVEELRKLAYQDINKCMALGLKMSLKEVSSRGTKPHKNTREAFEYYAVAK